MTALVMPTAEGNLARTPFAHVLAYVRERQLSGTLVVRCAGALPDLAGESRLTLERGGVARVQLPRMLEPLGTILREHDAVTDVQLEAALARVRAGEGVLGRVLLAMGACDARAIERAMRTQVRRNALRLFEAREAPFRFFAEGDPLIGPSHVRCREDVAPLVSWGVRMYPDPAVLDAVLGRLAPHTLRLRADADLNALELSSAEQAVLDMLRCDAAPVYRLLAVGDDAQAARIAVYLLVVLRQVDVVAAADAPPLPGGRALLPPGIAYVPSVITRPITGKLWLADPPPLPGEPAAARRQATGRAVAAAPPAGGAAGTRAQAPGGAQAPPDASDQAAEAERYLRALQDQTYFEMLSVAEDAPPAAAHVAFLQRAPRWNPDRVPPTEPALREASRQIYALLTRARGTLCDPAARERYVLAARAGRGTPNARRETPAHADAASDVYSAELCLRRGQVDEAERLAQRALMVSPGDPAALVVLAASLLERAPAAGPFDEPRALLQQAIAAAPGHDGAHHLLGMLYKRQGDPGRALAHFRAAVEANPRNLDAMREVRVAEMRQRQGGATPAAGLPAAGVAAIAGQFLSSLLKR